MMTSVQKDSGQPLHRSAGGHATYCGIPVDDCSQVDVGDEPFWTDRFCDLCRPPEKQRLLSMRPLCWDHDYGDSFLP